MPAGGNENDATIRSGGAERPIRPGQPWVNDGRHPLRANPRVRITCPLVVVREVMARSDACAHDGRGVGSSPEQAYRERDHPGRHDYQREVEHKLRHESAQ